MSLFALTGFWRGLKKAQERLWRSGSEEEEAGSHHRWRRRWRKWLKWGIEKQSCIAHQGQKLDAENPRIHSLKYSRQPRFARIQVDFLTITITIKCETHYLSGGESTDSRQIYLQESKWIHACRMLHTSTPAHWSGHINLAACCKATLAFLKCQGGVKDKHSETD